MGDYDIVFDLTQAGYTAWGFPLAGAATSFCAGYCQIQSDRSEQVRKSIVILVALLGLV